MDMKFINLTPHEIKIVTNAQIISLPPSGTEARIKSVVTLTENIDGIPIYTTKYSDPIGLPLQSEGTCLIVSSMVKDKCPYRHDLFSPSSLIRDEKGVMIGCQGLSI